MNVNTTIRDVIAKTDPEGVDDIINDLDAAGFVIVAKEEIRKELADATASDKWHKYGEGYSGLRRYLEKLIGS